MHADKKQFEEGTVPHRVLLAAPAPPPYGGMAIQARLLEEQLLADGISVVFFASNLSFPGWLRPLERVPGIRTLICTALIWKRLWGEVRRTDVVHVLATNFVYFFAVVYPAVLYSRLQGKRVLLNYRGGDAKKFFHRYKWAIKPIFKWATVVSTPSQFLGCMIESYFQVPVLIVPNILKGSLFKYRQRHIFEPKLLVTRHLEKIYDVETALKAFRQIKARYPNASLWIAGTGSEEKHLRSLVSTWSLEDVRFLGYVAHSDLPPIYDQCDILLNASRVDNFPGALLEASGAGLVVVSTSAGGIPVMFQNGETALLAEPGDWEGLAGLVERVLQSPPLGSALTERAAMLAKQCDWKEIRKPLYMGYGFSQEENSESPLGMKSSAGVRG